MAGDLSFKQDNSGLTKKFLLLLFSLSKLKLRPHFQIIMFVMGLSLDYPAFCLSFKRLQFSGFFFATLYARESIIFCQKLHSFRWFFFRKKKFIHIWYFSAHFSASRNIHKNLSITLKVPFSLYTFALKKKKQNKYHWKKYQNLLHNEIFLPDFYNQRSQTI